MVDAATKKTLASIPLLKTKAGPRDRDDWPTRLKEEYQSLIKYVGNNKAQDNDWFRLESNKEGTRWWGKCWHIHNLLKVRILGFAPPGGINSLIYGSQKSRKKREIFTYFKRFETLLDTKFPKFSLE